MYCECVCLSGTKYTDKTKCQAVLNIVMSKMPKLANKYLSTSIGNEASNSLWVWPSGVSVHLEIKGEESELYKLFSYFEMGMQTDDESADLYKSIFEALHKTK